MEYHLFISHSWTHTNAYICLTDLLKKAKYFTYYDYSVPESKKLTIYNKANYDSELWNKIANKMSFCHVVIILAGVYATYSESIRMEIDIAKSLGKPILAIEPFGSEKTSTVVKDNADMIVKWNTNSIVDAIRSLSR